MCTAITYKTNNHYFGRTLDIEAAYNETVTITPRNFNFEFKKVPAIKNHHAIIGMAYICDGYPLYYDATNEMGLSISGLNFPKNAVYQQCNGMDNIAPFELIPYILGQCESIKQVKKLLRNINICDIPFNASLPLAPLHWIIADRNSSVVVESAKDGMKIYDNPVGVLTNNPSFDMQMIYLNNYVNLSAYEPTDGFCDSISINRYCLGLGGFGLPGDLSSMSRFVRAAFTKLNSVSDSGENESVSQFFHILSSVNQTRGCVRLESGKYEATMYTSCCNTDKGLYYYKTYYNSQISCVDMFKENLEGNCLISYPLVRCQQINMQN